MANDKLNIGLLTTELEDPYARAVCEGAIVGARDNDVNLFIFPGRYVDAEYNDKERSAFDYQYNTIFEYPNKDNMDGLLVMLGVIGTTMSRKKQREFLKKYEGIPIMLVGCELDNYSNVVVDNRTGLDEEINHLINHHNVKKIGFVSGPATNNDAVERLQVYEKALRDNGIPYDESYVAYGNFSEYSVDVTLELLNRHPDIEAIVCANDQMAIGVYKAIQTLGKRVGIDIFVAGFDDAPCCTQLLPNLTTVKADAGSLGIQAVSDLMNLIENPKLEIHSSVDTTMVQRNSCGCRGFQLSDVNKYSDIKIEDTDDPAEIAEILNNYLFHSYSKSKSIIKAIRDDLKDFFTRIIELYKDNNLDEYEQEILSYEFLDLISGSLKHYITSDVMFSGLDVLMQKLFTMSASDEQQLKIVGFVNTLYKHESNERRSDSKRHENEIAMLNDQINRITQDMLIFDHDDDAVYGTVIDKLSRLHINSSLLYIFNHPIIHYEEEKWELPISVDLKGFSDGQDVFSLPEKDQRVLVCDLFRNQFMPDDRRYTMVVSPLYSSLDHYGILFSEVDAEYFDFIRPITNQLFAAIKIIYLLKDRADTQEKLQISLKQIQENNLKLDVVAKSDELTGIYNRRGFLNMANELMQRPVNQGCRLMAVYADMDNLKIVNDRFGHEEGDYALKLIAEVLMSTFRSSDIVARMGGDEFAVLAMVGDEIDIEKKLRKRINKLIREKNMANDKEYYVGMSLGFYEFACSGDVDILNIMDKADKKLYEEKKNKNKIVYKSELKD
ncbi:MAG: GGDEF domain-containing protein [Lachnospiraceae bacterium]|nr:GGDEF domain-containing protein [Lachnospiraceae bacterium]